MHKEDAVKTGLPVWSGHHVSSSHVAQALGLPLQHWCELDGYLTAIGKRCTRGYTSAAFEKSTCSQHSNDFEGFEYSGINPVTNLMEQERLLENQVPMIDHRRKAECIPDNTAFHASVDARFRARPKELGWDLADILPARGNDNHQGDELLDVPYRLHTLPSLASLATVVHAWHQLEQSGFYWGSTSQAATSAAIASEPEGTFLVRDSSATN
uniref:uncharacterized protein n=1 Tax=Myxine glutinosa TaxID=7769 RepID=UPI00358EBDF6